MTFPFCAGHTGNGLGAEALNRAVTAQETIMSNDRQTAFPSSSTTGRDARRGHGACPAATPAPYVSKSEKRWPAAQAADVAIELGRMLKPLCSRIVIAGSLRRHKPFVGDIELLYVSRSGSRPKGLFDTEEFSLTEQLIQDLLSQGVIRKRPKIDGTLTWGDLNKLGIHSASGIPVDLFATTEANWWVSLVVKTGSKETNLRLTTGAQRLGRTLNAGGCGVTNADGSVTPATSEEHVFELCGVPYLTPRER